MTLVLAIFIVAYLLGCWLAYQGGVQDGAKQAALPEVLDARLQAARAEREMWDITRRAFESMAERARER